MPTLHVHRMPDPAQPPPNVQGVHYTMLLPDLPENITTYLDFMHWIQDNPSIMGQLSCCITTLQKHAPPT